MGGIIPEEDVPRLLELGVARVFGPGTPLDEIAAFLRAQRAAARSNSSDAHIRVIDAVSSRLLSLAATGGRPEPPSGPPAPSAGPRPRVIAVTGSGGVGKSTLIGG